LRTVAVTQLKNGRYGPAPELEELVVTGWAGQSPGASGITLEEYCRECGYTHYSAPTHPEHLIEESQWDGSDFFIVWPMPGHIFVTERVLQVATANNLKGAAFVPVSEMRHLADGFTPGSLEHYFSPQVVRRRKADVDYLKWEH
jgi:hypothetical protein